jgi:hypothetical protein
VNKIIQRKKKEIVLRIKKLEEKGEAKISNSEVQKNK